MFVLGVDPGLTRCGYGLVTSGEGSQRYRAVAAGTIETEPTAPVGQRLWELSTALDGLLDQYRPDAVVVEHVFFQTNAKTATGVAQASGIALSRAIEHRCVVAQYTSNEVKLAIVGYGAATKQQVQSMVTRQLALTVPPPPDAADALALALCHLAGSSFRDAVGAASASS
jgi:crossover junction endodeoxyribonuclease RuvC